MNFGKLNLTLTPPACRLDGEKAPALDVRCEDYLGILARPCRKTPGSCFKWLEMPIRNQIPAAPLECIPASFCLVHSFPSISLTNVELYYGRRLFWPLLKSPSLGKARQRCKTQLPKPRD
jgi:hypothetical protein